MAKAADAPKPVPQIIKRPDATLQPAAAAAAGKVLTIGGDGSASAKVLTIGGTAAPKKEEKKVEVKETPKPESGAKVAAAKAVTKSTPASTGKSSPAPADGKASPAQSAVEKAQIKREADAVLKEQEEEIDETLLSEIYGKVG